MLLSAGRVRAHAPPEVVRIVWQSADRPVLVSNRGLIFGVSEHAFELMCGEALDINSGEQPKIAFRADGALLAATSNGLSLTRDQGCSWEGVPPLDSMFITALAQLPGQPDALLAATFGMGQSAIRATRDGGDSWSVLHALVDRDYTRALLVAPRDPKLLYVSGAELVSNPAPVQHHYTARSLDGGENWERTEIALEPDEVDLTLLGINPSRPEELVARATSSNHGFMADRLLVSQDGGRSFSSPLSTLSLAAAAFSADGAWLWAASKEGLWRAGATRDDFEPLGDAKRVTCVSESSDGALWMCGSYQGLMSLADGIGRSPDGSGQFETFMNFTDVRAQVACDASSETARVCATWWSDFQYELFPLGVDAGIAADSGADAAASAEPVPDAASAEPAPDAAVPAAADRPVKHSSGCAVAAGATPRVGALASVLLALLARLARRTRGRRRAR